MKRITKIILGLAFCTPMFGNAQTLDSVSTGAGYTNQVYYSLENGIVKTSVKEDWDLAFEITGITSTIRVNGATGTSVYLYPNGGISSWSNMDTTGLYTWSKLNGNYTKWSNGELTSTINESNPLDLGWGMYNMTTHAVTGDSLYVLRLSDGSWKKLWIVKLQSGVYSFKYGNLDNSEEKEKTIAKASFVDRNFGYYSILNEKSVDIEPSNKDWDLMFAQYVDILSPGVFYGVSGIIANVNVQTAKVANVPVDEAGYWDQNYTTMNNIIGHDWKTFEFSTYSYRVDDSLSYFVQDLNGNTWQMVCTGFSGSSSGTFYFTKEKVGFVGLGDKGKNIEMNVYPNPLSTGASNFYIHSENSGEYSVNMYDVSGILVYSGIKQFEIGQNAIEMNKELMNGLYILEFSGKDSKFVSKLIVK